MAHVLVMFDDEASTVKIKIRQDGNDREQIIGIAISSTRFYPTGCTGGGF
jgi:hypothetical protein